MSEETKRRIAERLNEADLDVQRFIQCEPGVKRSVDHELRYPNEVSSNYGIYAEGSDHLCILDIDDYGDLDDKSGISALSQLPETLEQGSPHGGTHRFYRVEPTDDGRLVSAALADAFGSNQGNLNASWGEIRTSNYYVVGAGSQLHGCDKEWHDCSEPDEGQYAIKTDREIATITAEQLIQVLSEDPKLSKKKEQTEPRREKQPSPMSSTSSFDLEERLDLAREKDDKLDRLMNGNYSDYRDSAADGGVDRSAAESALAMKLGWWLEGEKRTVEKAMDHHARAEKWAERDDDSYRESILSAVDKLTDFYDPESGEQPDPPSELDWSEVERGEAILESQTTHDNPVGELVESNGCYAIPWENRDADGNLINSGVDRATNFTLETLSFLRTEEGTEFVIRVHPNHPTEDPYDVRVEPAVFNSQDTFKSDVVIGRTTSFTPNNREHVPVATILANLRETVGSQNAPHRQGTPHIGLSENREEYVTPLGSLTADGWSDDPDYQFYTKGGGDDEVGALPQKWQLDPEDQIDVDESDIVDICELLPRIREPERGLPMLGWFYAAPLKPYIHDWEDEFPLLSPHGDTGTGKTSAVRTLMKAFGGDGEPFSASDTSFTIEKHLAESRGFPVWFDEYKPTEMAEHRLKRLHRRLKEVTKERTLAKGTPDLGEVTLHLRAPVVISGEQKIEDPAVQRRAIITNLSQAATRDGTETKQAFGKLTGTAYEDGGGSQHYPDGYDLSVHARAYYQWLLQRSGDELREAWHDARERVKDILGRFGITVEESEQRGLQTVIFGLELYTEFATDFGADESDLVSDREIREACAHVVENIGKDGQRREHADEFLEVLTLAATEGYLEPGVHHRTLESRSHECEVLAVHMPSAFPAVKRYVRDSNLEDDYTILSKTDYLDSFSNKVQDDSSYVVETNKKVRGIDNGSKAVYFDHEGITEKLGSSFNIDAFRPAEERGAEDGNADVTPIEEVSPEGNPYATVTVTVENYEEGPDDTGISYLGTVRDATAPIDIIDYFGGIDLQEGHSYRLEDVRVSTYETSKQLELVEGVTEATEIQSGAGTTDPDGSGGDPDAEQVGLDGHQEAAADGGSPTLRKGEEPEGSFATICTYIENHYQVGDEFTIPTLVGEVGESPESVRNAVQRLAERGDVLKDRDSYEVI